MGRIAQEPHAILWLIVLGYLTLVASRTRVGRAPRRATLCSSGLVLYCGIALATARLDSHQRLMDRDLTEMETCSKMVRAQLYPPPSTLPAAACPPQ
jgi:hypothetical protein